MAQGCPGAAAEGEGGGGRGGGGPGAPLSHEPWTITINKKYWMNYSIMYYIGIRDPQKTVSCFQEDIDLIFKISNFCLTDLHHCSVRVFSKSAPQFQNSWFSKLRDLLTYYFSKCSHSSYIQMYSGIFRSVNNGSQKLNNPEIMEMLSFDPSNYTSEPPTRN